MRDVTQCAFGLSHLVEMYTGDNKNDLVGHLLRVQQTAVQDLIFERLRAASSLEFCKSHVPETLRTTNFTDEKQWFLAC